MQQMFISQPQLCELIDLNIYTLRAWLKDRKKFTVYRLPGLNRFYQPEIVNPNNSALVIDQEQFTIVELAAFLGLKTHKTLEMWQRDQTPGEQPEKGPIFHGTGKRTIYKAADVLQWLNSIKTLPTQ